nr:transcriptional regulator [Acinetobacter nectaris]
MLGITRSTLRDLPKKDPSFPKCYKFGNTRQAPVYYDYADLLAWHNAQKEKATGVEA